MSAAIPSPVLPPVPAAPEGSRPIVGMRVGLLLARSIGADRAAAVLPIVAFGVVTTLLLTVLGGAMGFFRWTTETAGLYQILSLVALALLVIPLVSLGGAAARLSARRRDDRLATLRLLGATTGLVTRLAVLESLLHAAVGTALGLVGYVAIMPFVGLLRFGGDTIGVAGLWVGVPVLAATVAGVLLVAAVSAFVGMRGVVVDPLGVRAKREAPRMHWARLAIGVGVVVVAAGVMGSLGGDLLVMTIGVVGSLAATIAVLNLVGPFVISVVARRQAKRARTVPALIAARRVLESPLAAWRQVGGVAMTTFVAVVAGSGLAMMDLAGADGGDPEGAVLVADIRTGLVVTLVISFVMVACSVGVNQAASALDRKDLSVALDRMGVPRRTMEAARRRAVLVPLLAVTGGSAIAGGALVLPLLGASLVFAPLSMAVVLGCILAGVGIVLLAIVATRPVVTAVLAAPERV